MGAAPQLSLPYVLRCLQRAMVLTFIVPHMGCHFILLQPGISAGSWTVHISDSELASLWINQIFEKRELLLKIKTEMFLKDWRCYQCVWDKPYHMVSNPSDLSGSILMMLWVEHTLLRYYKTYGTSHSPFLISWSIFYYIKKLCFLSKTFLSL